MTNQTDITTQIEAKHCTKVDFNWTIEDVSLDFTIHFSVFREVFKIENHLEQLPLAAQNMILTKRQRILLNNFVEVLPLIVPMAIDRIFIGAEWRPFLEAHSNLLRSCPSCYPPTRRLLNQAWLESLGKAPRDVKLIIEKIISSDRGIVETYLSRAIHHHNASLLIEFTIQFFPSLRAMDLEKDALQVIARNPPKEFHSIFFAASKELDKNKYLQRIYLPVICNSPTEDVKTYLVERFIKDFNETKARTFNLKLRKNFDYKVCETLIQFSSNYDDTVFTEFLLNVLVGVHHSLSEKALHTLHKRGFSETALYHLLYTGFVAEYYRKNHGVFLELCKEFNDTSLRPSIDELMDRMEFYGYRLKLSTLFSSLSERVYNRLHRMIKSSDYSQRYELILQLSDLGRIKDVSFLLDIYEGQEYEHKRLILDVVLQILTRENGIEFLDWFLAVKENEAEEIRLQFLHCIGKISQVNPHTPALSEFLIKELNRPKSSEKMLLTVLRTIRDDPKSIYSTEVENLVQHKNESVSKNAKRLLRLIKRRGNE